MRLSIYPMLREFDRALYDVIKNEPPTYRQEVRNKRNAFVVDLISTLGTDIAEHDTDSMIAIRNKLLSFHQSVALDQLGFSSKRERYILWRPYDWDCVYETIVQAWNSAVDTKGRFTMYSNKEIAVNTDTWRLIRMSTRPEDGEWSFNNAASEFGNVTFRGIKITMDVYLLVSEIHLFRFN